MSLLSLTHAFLQEHGLANKPGLVAVSGGADSVALAHVLVQLRARNDLPGLALVHLNHCLRGSTSDEDERFIQSLPTDWQAADVPCYAKRQDVAALAQENHWNLEDAGRRARYEHFTEIARQSGAAWVATGHSADDQAETVLLRLIRGSGLRGLSGIPAIRPLAPGIVLVRPLLAVRRAQIRDYLTQHAISWREDASNQDTRFLRNRVRQELIPFLERDFQEDIIPLLAHTAEQASEVQAFIEELATALLVRAERPRAGATLVFDQQELAASSALLMREMFRLVWRREGWPLAEMGWLDWKRVAAVARGDAGGGDFPGHIRARRKGRVVQVTRLNDKRR